MFPRWGDTNHYGYVFPYGITGSKGDWFRSYLSHSTHTFVVKDCKSGETFAMSSVP